MRLLALIGVLAILAGIGGAVFIFGGYYDVSAAPEHPPVVAWALAHIRQASISRHATDAPPKSLDDPNLVQAGARAFAARGCVNCHGAPGVKWAKFSEGLNPDPPDLKDVVGGLEGREIFWVVKNGIGMTGMPKFGSNDVPDEEIWSIAAFVKKLPIVSDQDYKAWTASGAN